MLRFHAHCVIRAQIVNHTTTSFGGKRRKFTFIVVVIVISSVRCQVPNCATWVYSSQQNPVTLSSNDNWRYISWFLYRTKKNGIDKENWHFSKIFYRCWVLIFKKEFTMDACVIISPVIILHIFNKKHDLYFIKKERTLMESLRRMKTIS